MSVTSQGQATIPKKFRQKLNLQTPGRVKFREDEDGNVTIEQVRDIGDVQEIATTETSLTGELREQRKRDPDREETAAAEFPQTKS